jgi:CheY-like chemotaxis protein/HPt (histidine-containing phosphotransfer) domain-containing protein
LRLGRKIHEDPALRGPAIVLMIGAGEAVTAFTAEPWLSGVLGKPVGQSELHDAMVSAVRGRRTVKREVRRAAAAARARAPRKAKILLAEDHDINRELVREFLKMDGYACECAHNGREALRAFRERAFDLVLMDCQMPEMDGYEATRAIRRHEQRRRAGNGSRRVPIVALTAHATAEERERCLSAGMDDYLSKPLDPGLFRQTVERWLLANKPRAADGEGDADTAAEPSTVAGGGGTTVFDREALLTRCAGNEALADRLVVTFREQLETDLAALDEAVSGGDAATVMRAAHRIKGAAANVSAEALRAAAAHLEAEAAAGNLDEARSLPAAVREAARQFRDAVSVAAA